MKTLFFIAVIVFISHSSCQKNKPAVGKYFCYLNSFSGGQHCYPVQIIETQKSEFTLLTKEGTYQMIKDKHNFHGMFHSGEYLQGMGVWYHDSILVHGTWEKRDEGYVLTGNYHAIQHDIHLSTQTSYSVPVEGTFEIVPKE